MIELMVTLVNQLIVTTLIHEASHLVAFRSLGINAVNILNMTYPDRLPSTTLGLFYVGIAGGLGASTWLLLTSSIEDDAEDLVAKQGLIGMQLIYGLTEGLWSVHMINTEYSNLLINTGGTIASIIMGLIIMHRVKNTYKFQGISFSRATMSENTIPLIIKARARAEEAKAELYSRITIQFLLGLAMVLALAYYMYMGIQFLLLSGLEGMELFNAWVNAWELIIDRIIYLLAGAGFIALMDTGGGEQ